MQLVTERLLLREFEPDDWRDVMNYQIDPLYLRYVPWTERAEADVRNFVGMFLHWREERPRYRYQVAIVLRESGKLIGNCGVRSSPARPWEGEMGYELDDRYWGKGYATEAGEAMLGFAFSEMQLHRVFANCIAENIGSERVMQKLGMRFEGRFYENTYMRDRWWDTLYYAILDREWRTR
jgi:RimJ/RimL family protein N-acetyltransferase